jgi:hypothetical protein
VSELADTLDRLAEADAERRRLVVELAADYACLLVYDDERRRLGYDYGAGQRAAELSRVRAELADACRAAGRGWKLYLYAGIDELLATVGPVELRRAWERTVGGRLAKNTARSPVQAGRMVNAARVAAVRLGLVGVVR